MFIEKISIYCIMILVWIQLFLLENNSSFNDLLICGSQLEELNKEIGLGNLKKHNWSIFILNLINTSLYFPKFSVHFYVDTIHLSRFAIFFKQYTKFYC